MPAHADTAAPLGTSRPTALSVLTATLRARTGLRALTVSLDRRPTQSLYRLSATDALRLHPAFGEARVLRVSAALRPALDDHRPAVVQREGVWHINGLYRHGYLCAPAVVDELAQKLLAVA